METARKIEIGTLATMLLTVIGFAFWLGGLNSAVADLKSRAGSDNLVANSLVMAIDHTGTDANFGRALHLDTKSLVLIYASSSCHATGRVGTELQVFSAGVRVTINNKPVAANYDTITVGNMDHRFDNSVSYFAILDKGDYVVSAERVLQLGTPQQAELTLKVQLVGLNASSQ